MTRSPDPYDIEVGNRLRQKRQERGLSQEALAAAANVSFQQLQKYETGANRMSLSKFRLLAGKLDVPMSYLLGETISQADREIEAQAIRLSRSGLRLANAFDKIGNGRQRRALVDLVGSLVDEDLAEEAEL